MFKVVTKRFLNEAKTICLFEIEAPLVAKHAQAGQFVIFRLDEQANAPLFPLRAMTVRRAP